MEAGQPLLAVAFTEMQAWLFAACADGTQSVRLDTMRTDGGEVRIMADSCKLSAALGVFLTDTATAIDGDLE